MISYIYLINFPCLYVFKSFTKQRDEFLLIDGFISLTDIRRGRTQSIWKIYFILVFIKYEAKHVFSEDFFLWNIMCLVFSLSNVRFVFTSRGLMCLIVFLFCLFGYSGAQHMLCCVFCFVCFRFVCQMMPVSLDCTFLIASFFFFFLL